MSPSSPTPPSPRPFPSASRPTPATAAAHHPHSNLHQSSHQLQRQPPTASLNVIVTGGSTGIGAAIVRVFAASGHRVLFTYLTGRPRALKLQTAFPNATPVLLDQADVNSVAQFASFATRWASHDGVHVLINNAALGSATVDNYIDMRRDAALQRAKHQRHHLHHLAGNGNGNGASTPPRTSALRSSADEDFDGRLVAASLADPAPPKGRSGYGDGERGANGRMQAPINDRHHPPPSSTSTRPSSPPPPPSQSSIERMVERAQRDEALVRVNALGPLWVTDALTDLLCAAAYAGPQRRATVIFIGSVGGGSSAVFPEYCAADLMSKAGMTYLSKHIAARYVRDPIDVLCLSPGATETEMFRKSTLDKVSDPERFVDGMPKRRLIQPEDIAHTVHWLATASPQGIFHGAVLDASMGLAVRPGLQTETVSSR